MKAIQLGGKKYPGLQTWVDDEDYDRLMQHKWHPRKHHTGTFYASTSLYEGSKPAGTMTMHRLLMDAKPGEIVDHINGDTLLNIRANLRITTGQQNSFNRKKESTGRINVSRFKGVQFRKRCPKNPWEANIRHNYKAIYIGNFATEEEAATAYDRKALEIFGPYAKTNFPSASTMPQTEHRLETAQG